MAVTTAAAQQITMKIGHPLTSNSPLHYWAEALKSGIEKRAPGRVKTEIYPTSQLGAIPRMIEGAQLGTIEVIEVAAPFLAGVDPRFAVVASPGVFDSMAHGHRTLHDPEFKRVYWPLGEAKGLKMVGMTCDAPFDYAFAKPLRRLADFKGRKIRIFGSRLEVEAMRRLGATGVPMPLSDAVPALQQRALDGDRTAITVFVAFKYNTVVKYAVKTGLTVLCVAKLASKAWFDKLPGDLQRIIMEEAANADEKTLPWTEVFIERLYKVWVKQGGELSELPPGDLAEMRRRMSTVGDDVLKHIPPAFKLYQIMKAAAQRNRKG
jgi:TRAP-type C4-dicarboxylate transport system substrate-binding protein